MPHTRLASSPAAGVQGACGERSERTLDAGEDGESMAGCGAKEGTDLMTVNRRDEMMVVDDVEDAVSVGRSQRDPFSSEGSRDPNRLIAKGDASLPADLADQIIRAELHLRDPLGVAAGTLTITPRRDLEIERFVRSLEVVDLAPLIESQLALWMVL